MPDNLQTKTTKLINYAKSQLSSKGVTSTATTLRGALDDIANISTGGTQATLNAPTISLSGSTLTLTNPTTNGDFATGFNIYNGSALLATQLIDATTLDLSTLLTEEGASYTITAKCYGTNMTESSASNSVSYTVIEGYTVTINYDYGSGTTGEGRTGYSLDNGNTWNDIYTFNGSEDYPIVLNNVIQIKFRAMFSSSSYIGRIYSNTLGFDLYTYSTTVYSDNYILTQNINDVMNSSIRD